MKEISSGKITIKMEEQVIYEVDILAENSIRKKKFGDYFFEVTQDFFRNNLEMWIKQMV